MAPAPNASRQPSQREGCRGNFPAFSQGFTPARTAIISAATEMAISAGVYSPMGRPMGAWTQAYSASVKPAASSLSRQSASFFREPMHPMYRAPLRRT